MRVDNHKHSYCPRCNKLTFLNYHPPPPPHHYHHGGGSVIESLTRDQEVAGRHCLVSLSFVCLFDLILYVHSTIFQLCGTGFLG